MHRHCTHTTQLHYSTLARACLSNLTYLVFSLHTLHTGTAHAPLNPMTALQDLVSASACRCSSCFLNPGTRASLADGCAHESSLREAPETAAASRSSSSAAGTTERVTAIPAQPSSIYSPQLQSVHPFPPCPMHSHQWPHLFSHDEPSQLCSSNDRNKHSSSSLMTAAVTLSNISSSFATNSSSTSSRSSADPLAAEVCEQLLFHVGFLAGVVLSRCVRFGVTFCQI